MADRLDDVGEPTDKVREAAEHVARAIKILGDSYGKGRAEVESNARCACFDAKYALDAALDAPLAAPSGGDATRDEAVRAYLVVDGCGETWGVFPTKGEADLCVSACNATGTHGGGRPGPFRVVALVPQKGGAR